MTAQLAFDFSSAVRVVPANRTHRQVRGQLANLSGIAAESIVERHYSRRGLDVICRRWRGPAGEIDLIVADGDGFIFVEVKKSRTFDRAAESLGASQMRRIYSSAECYLANAPLGQLSNVRFDLALVDGIGDVRIIENAFGMQ